MRSRFGRVVIPLGMAAIVSVLWLTVLPTAGQQAPPGRQSASFPPYKAPRLADGHPDLNGLWQAFVTANIDLQDHEAQAGPHTELLARTADGPPGRVSWKAVRFRTSRRRWRRRGRTSRTG
jgi:hypothetical protein